jgi:hypothetical protein
MRPDSTGTLKPARGYLRWTPVRGWSTNGAALVLPMPFRVKLVAGATSVTVDPTTVDWAWEVTYELFGLPHEKRYYSVPNSGTPLDINTLTQVAPLTGQSAGPLPENWSVALAAAVSSALAGQIAPAVAAAVAAEFANGIDVGPQVTAAVNAAVPAAVSAQVPGAVTTAVNAALPSAVSSAVSAAVPSAVSTEVAAAVPSAVNAAVPGAVSTAVNAAVPGAVSTAVTAQVPGAATAAVSAALPAAVTAEVAAKVATLPASIKVITGSEVRPTTTGSVSWIGGTTKPTNMVNGDVWFKAVP